MFSCCALFSNDESTEADTEHLKALDEVHRASEGEMSISVNEDGVTTDYSKEEFESTPLVTSPRAAAAQQRFLEASTAAEMAESAAVQATIGKSQSAVEERAAAMTEAAAQLATKAAEASALAAEETRAAAQTAAETAGVERTELTLKALREAEDAAQSAAAEAEKRRFEEEESARAARKAESEAKKAIWRAEEAQRLREQAGSKAAEEAASVHRIAQEEAELARRQTAAARMEKARTYLSMRLLSEEGLRLQKHGRNGKSTYRTLTATDNECRTLTWGKARHDLRSMQEVRRGTDPDPAFPGLTGTSELRRSKAASAALDRSFSLLFPSRSLDFTVATKDECEHLVLGFQSLGTSQRC